MEHLVLISLPIVICWNESETWSLSGDFRMYNAAIQKKDAFLRKNPTTWRPATEEERTEIVARMEKEKERYDTSLKIGGIDSRGNYTALHHRGEDPE